MASLENIRSAVTTAARGYKDGVSAGNKVVTAAEANPEHGLNTNGAFWVRMFLIPICLIFISANIYDARTVSDSGSVDWSMPSLGLLLNAAFFLMMLLVV